MEATQILKRTVSAWRAERLDEAAWCVIGVLVLTATAVAAAAYVICGSPAVDAGALAGMGR